MSNVMDIAHAQTAMADVRAEIRGIVERDDVTYSTIARESAISGTALSQFMSESYRGDNSKIAGQLSIWLENRSRRANEMPEAPDFVQTKTARQIWSALQYAQLAQCITVIYGSPGVGKTRSLQQFVSERPNVWLITVSPSRASLSEALYELALELGVGDAPRRAGQLGRAVRRKLRGTNGLLIIDEADHLDYPVLEELRILQEETGIGLALVGNPPHSLTALLYVSCMYPFKVFDGCTDVLFSQGFVTAFGKHRCQAECVGDGTQCAGTLG
ncbi:AAA family ATPase [Yersinia pseudotuberculosis]|uniref:AAA family ATPase n=1 Tax=Yersinia pseudotuberculosis TaxID=633 RepID=UPI000F6D1613|nr:AAA family ATPase [Yersinia pseudotuberculosis]VEE73056.1 XRE family transcriptional regulator [Yersinia pseudotuberculosis]